MKLSSFCRNQLPYNYKGNAFNIPITTTSLPSVILKNALANSVAPPLLKVMVKEHFDPAVMCHNVKLIHNCNM